MKKNRILLEILILIGTIIPFVIVYFLKGKAPFIEFDRYLKGVLIIIPFLYFYPLYIYQKNNKLSFSTKINLWFRLSWLLLSIAFGGVFLFHTLFPTLNLSYKIFFVLLGVMSMIQGNYRVLITKNSGVYMGIIVDSITDKNIYKKVQRKMGLLEFWLGAAMAILCFVIPNIEENFMYLVVSISFIILFGQIWIKNSESNKQAINQ
jgi:hypothetical protein